MQPETKLETANSSTNQTLIEEFRYRTAADLNGSHLTAEMSLYKDLEALSRIGFPVKNFTQRENPSQVVFVTASDDRFFYTSMDAVARVQLFYPNNAIYFYDLSDGVLDDKVDKVRNHIVDVQNHGLLIGLGRLCKS